MIEATRKHYMGRGYQSTDINKQYAAATPLRELIATRLGRGEVVLANTTVVLHHDALDFEWMLVSGGAKLDLHVPGRSRRSLRRCMRPQIASSAARGRRDQSSRRYPQGDRRDYGGTKRSRCRDEQRLRSAAVVAIQPEAALGRSVANCPHDRARGRQRF